MADRALSEDFLPLRGVAGEGENLGRVDIRAEFVSAQFVRIVLAKEVV